MQKNILATFAAIGEARKTGKRRPPQGRQRETREKPRGKNGEKPREERENTAGIFKKTRTQKRVLSLFLSLFLYNKVENLTRGAKRGASDPRKLLENKLLTMPKRVPKGVPRQTNDYMMGTNETFNEGLFNCESGGYVIISRAMALSLLKQLREAGPNELYLFLLVHANFATTRLPGKKGVKRGELDMNVDELSRWLPASRSTLYRHVRTLEASHVLLRDTNRNRLLFILPKYEEHCGKLAAGKERQDRGKAAAGSGDSTGFDRFFEYYHYAMGIAPRDREKALREWKRLGPEERENAMEHVSAYAEASERQQFKKQAFSYLRDKSFKH